MTPTKISKRIEYWESKGLSKMKSTKTKTYKETVEKLHWTIDGTHVYINSPISMTDFKKSVDNYSTYCLSQQYKNLRSKKASTTRQTLSKFIFDPFAPQDYRTALKVYLQRVPTPPMVRYPKFYDFMLKTYLKIGGSGTKSFNDLSQNDLVNISWASNKLGAYWKNHVKKVYPNMGGARGITEAFFNASMSFINDDLTKMSTSLLTRRWVWEKFPNYLDQKGYLMSQESWSIYNN